MLQKITNLKKRFQRNKTDVHTSVDSIHGTRCILHITNLALLALVIVLSAASVLVYYLIPVTTVSDLSEMIDVREMEITNDVESPDSETIDGDSEKDVAQKETFSVINEKNMFSHMRKEWVVKAVIPKAPDLKKERAKRGLAKKKALAGKPKKIILHGVVIAGSLKRALINNPLKGVSKKTTMYVEEGDELEGYKVTSIEKDKIRLDWHGEEIIVTLYSGIKDKKSKKPADSAGRRKRSSLSKLDYRFKVVEDAQTEEDLDVISEQNKKVALADIPDNNSLNLMYNEPGYFSMPAFEGKPLSGAVEMQEVVETFPDVGSNGVYDSNEEQEIFTKLEYKFKIIDDRPAREISDVDDVEVKEVALVDIPDKSSFNLVYNEPEYFSMPAFEGPQLSEASEMKEIDKIFSDIEYKNRSSSEEGQKTIKAQVPPLIELAVIEKPKQNPSSGEPTEVLLHGIVIVTSRDIKKALVNIPMSPFRKERTLYVEEGDAFEGFKVTSIEPDVLRLDWHGKEMIVKFPLL